MQTCKVNIYQIVIDQVDKTKFLEVFISENLKWNDHIKTITNKVSKNIGIILKIIRIVLVETSPL